MIESVFDPEIEFMEKVKSEFSSQAQILEEIQQRNISTKKQIEN